MTQTVHCGPDVLLTTDRLNKTYPFTVANKDISVVIPRGKIVGFVGENGSGKTTLIRLLCRLAFPTSGTFAFSDACRIGAIVETPSFHPNMTAEDNLRFQAKLCGTDEAKIPQILATVGLADTGAKKARSFSLGMRQRLGIAIALTGDPDFLILDEPTNGLDPQGIVEMRAFLKELCEKRGMTLLISSHILSELSLLAEHYLFIHKGEIVSSVSAEELFAASIRELRFYCHADATAFLREAQENAWVERAEKREEQYVLCNPRNYPAILRALAALDVTDIETYEESLETRYMNMMKGDGQA